MRDLTTRDEDIDPVEAFQRLLSLELEAKREGWTPARLLALANINLYMGNLKEAEKAAMALAEFDVNEAGNLLTAIEAERDRPLQTRRRYPSE